MKVRAAICWEARRPLEVDEVDLDGPRAGECLVRLVATGVCHTDAYTMSGRDPEGRFPVVLGHEGAGVVEEVGPGVTSLRPGDHVVLSSLLSCGSCHYCERDQVHLCEAGVQAAMNGEEMVFRNGEVEIARLFGVGTFATRTL